MVTEKNKIRFGRIAIDLDQMRIVLIEQRQRLGLSHRGLAEKAGVAPTTIHNLEQGSYKVQLDKCLAVLGALELTPDQIIEVDGAVTATTKSMLEDEIEQIAILKDPAEALARLAEVITKSRKQ